jgi:signal transduction histidine kinase/CheY-like chemotaxis protein
VIAAKLPQWYFAYFFLAAFDILTITGSLYLNHTIVNIFSSSVSHNKTWALQLSEVEELRRLAGQVNAPGNDVFDSRDVLTEQARTKQAKLLFDQQFKRLLDSFQVQPGSDSFTKDLNNVQATLSLMLEETDKIFTLFRENQPGLAGERMATMDRNYATVNAAIATLSKRVQGQQLESLENDNKTTKDLQVFEYVIAFFIICMVTGASIYGLKIHRKMLQDAQEREELTKELTEAKNQAEAAAKAKNDFLTMMSHEIRTPLNGVAGLTELLQLTQLTPQQRQYATTIQSSAQSLSVIINDVLDFAKIEAGKLNTQTLDFNLIEVFEDTLSSLAPLAHKKGIELLCQVEPNLPENLKGDPTRLRQVLTNLLGNAVKFTKEGHVRLAATLLDKSDTDIVVKVEVSDSGLGISPEDQSKLFTPFTQASNVNIREHGGTGLGLTISKRIVEALGGQIGLSSVVGQGSTFWFTVRLIRREVTKPESLPLMGSVLIIDDNKINRQIVHEQLSSWNISNKSTAGGALGLSELREAKQKGAPYSLVILDYHMPNMNGPEVAREIRRNQQEFGEVKILLLTSVDNIKEGESDLFEHSLVKPVTRRTLLQGLHLLFGQSHLVVEASNVTKLSTKNILLAEDNPINQIVVLGMLEALGYHADIAPNGQEAVVASQTKSYDLIFMDCQMPILDGYMATQQIRALEKKRTPIIALTANVIDEAKEKAIAAGMDDYLSKPVTMKQLKEVLDFWFQTTRKPSSSLQGEIPLFEEMGVSKKIIALFVQLGPSQKQDVLNAPSAQERVAASHKLKGSALMLGLSQLAALCETIENKSKQGEDTHQELLAFENVFEQSLLALKNSIL